MLFAKRLPSISGDASMRSRNPARSARRRGRSRHKSTAIRTYSCAVVAMSSGRPRFIEMETPARPITVFPASVTTGTPIQNESILVVWPGQGNGSRLTSMPWYLARYWWRERRSAKATRPDSMPCFPRTSKTRRRGSPGGARRTSLDSATSRITLAQSSKPPALTLQKLFKHPNVIRPSASAGSGDTCGVLVRGE